MILQASSLRSLFPTCLSPSSFSSLVSKLSIRLHDRFCPDTRSLISSPAKLYIIKQAYLALERRVLRTQTSLEVMSGSMSPESEGCESKEWIYPPDTEQTRPACFGDGQFQIPDRSGSDRLCSTCMSLGHLESTLWDSINNFHEVIVKHHRSVSVLIESARGGCHLCGLLLIAWEETYRLDQDPTGEWVGRIYGESVSLNGDVTLRFKRELETAPFSGVEVDEVRITILCGDLPPGMVGRLICTPKESERSLFSRRPQLLTVNQRHSQSPSTSRNMSSYRQRH